jgi:hypothetical protein
MPISFDFKSLSKGLMHTGIPFIFKGMINEFLADRKVDIATAVGYVRRKQL